VCEDLHDGNSRELRLSRGANTRTAAALTVKTRRHGTIPAFSLIRYEVLYSRYISPLMGKIVAERMSDAVRSIISRSVNPGERDSFKIILDLLRRVEFKTAPVVDSVRVYEFLSQVGCDCETARRHLPEEEGRPTLWSAETRKGTGERVWFGLRSSFPYSGRL
jgi:hypothetical protein